jgi:ethanolamine transporter EutH
LVLGLLIGVYMGAAVVFMVVLAIGILDIGMNPQSALEI